MSSSVHSYQAMVDKQSSQLKEPINEVQSSKANLYRVFFFVRPQLCFYIHSTLLLRVKKISTWKKAKKHVWQTWSEEEEIQWMELGKIILKEMNCFEASSCVEGVTGQTDGRTSALSEWGCEGRGLFMYLKEDASDQSLDIGAWPHVNESCREIKKNG